MTDKNDAVEQPQEKPKRLRRDSMFYFDHITFLVEDSLFKVPRSPFEQGSQVFRDMFQLPHPESGIVDGSDDDHPLRLEQIKVEDFKNFLKALFPGPYRQGVTPTTTEEWISVLKMSTMWEFEVLRQHTIKKLGFMQIDCIEKVGLAVEYRIDEWLVPALNALAKRAKPITVEESKRLGLELTLKMAAVRESVRGKGRCRNCGSIDNAAAEIGERRIDNVDFSDHIRQMLDGSVQTANT